MKSYLASHIGIGYIQGIIHHNCGRVGKLGNKVIIIKHSILEGYKMIK